MIKEALAISYAPDLRVVQNTNQTAIIVAQAPGALSNISTAHDVPERSKFKVVETDLEAPAPALSRISQRRTRTSQEGRRCGRIGRHAMTNIGRKFRQAMQSLGFKMLMALAAAALPALAVAAILGMTLVREVERRRNGFQPREFGCP